MALASREDGAVSGKGAASFSRSATSVTTPSEEASTGALIEVGASSASIVVAFGRPESSSAHSSDMRFLAPRFARVLVGHLCRVVEAPPEGSEDLEREALNARERQLQVDAYVRLREVVACGASSTADASRGRKGDSVEEYVLKRAYNGLARDVCGFAGGSANPARAAKAAPSLAFATSCVAELYADASPDAAYRTAFVYVRQLALKVR